jgi:hypothetical protein
LAKGSAERFLNFASASFAPWSSQADRLSRADADEDVATEFDR